MAAEYYSWLPEREVETYGRLKTTLEERYANQDPAPGAKVHEAERGRIAPGVCRPEY